MTLDANRVTKQAVYGTPTAWNAPMAVHASHAWKMPSLGVPSPVLNPGLVDPWVFTAAPAAAPTLGQASTGGSLSNGAVYVRIAPRTGMGLGPMSPEATITLSGGTSTQVANVTIPALSGNIIGYDVFAGSASGATNEHLVASNVQPGTYSIKSIPGSGANPSAANNSLSDPTGYMLGA